MSKEAVSQPNALQPLDLNKVKGIIEINYESERPVIGRSLHGWIKNPIEGQTNILPISTSLVALVVTQVDADHKTRTYAQTYSGSVYEVVMDSFETGNPQHTPASFAAELYQIAEDVAKEADLTPLQMTTRTVGNVLQAMCVDNLPPCRIVGAEVDLDVKKVWVSYNHLARAVTSELADD